MELPQEFLGYILLLVVVPRLLMLVILRLVRKRSPEGLELADRTRPTCRVWTNELVLKSWRPLLLFIPASDRAQFCIESLSERASDCHDWVFVATPIVAWFRFMVQTAKVICDIAGYHVRRVKRRLENEVLWILRVCLAYLPSTDPADDINPSTDPTDDINS